MHSPQTIASAFVTARSSGQFLTGFPGGDIPEDLAFSYRCQEAAIAQWPDEIVGWKVGGVPPHLWQRLGVTRVVGPIFKKAVSRTTGGVTSFPVFIGGFAAVEAEFTMVLGQDAPADRLDWTVEQAREMVGAIHLSIETAGSPLAAINDLGPTVVASDFGNNAGLILGAALPDWRNSGFEQIVSRTVIDGIEVGSGNALTLSGGPFESLRLLLENCARRGRPLKAGTMAATGAITGVHDIAAGQTTRVEFGSLGVIECRAEPFAV